MAIIILGVPGTGKTTISKKIISEFPNLKYLNITQFVISNKLYFGYDKERKSYLIDVNKTRDFLFRKYASEHSKLLIDTHVIEPVPNQFRELCIVLHAPLSVIRKRLFSRGWHSQKVDENIMAELMYRVLDFNCKCIIHIWNNEPIEKMAKKLLHLIRIKYFTFD